MKLYVDIESKKLVQSLNSDRISTSPVFMQGDNEPLEIHLLTQGTSSLYEDKILNPQEDFLRVGIARFKGEPKLLSIASGYTPLSNGGVIINLPLNTVEIENALGNNASLDAFLEIEYSTSEGRIVTVLQSSCKVKNDLIENAPAIELQEQFYDKEYIDGAFVKKSELAETLESKADATSFEELLAAYNTREFLEKYGAYKGNLYLEYSLNHTFTMMFTYVKGKIGMPIKATCCFLESMYYDYGDILYIDPVAKKVAVYLDIDWDTYEYIYDYDYDFDADLYSGDKITIVYDDVAFTLKIYVNKTLASDISIGRKWTPYIHYSPYSDYLVDFRIFKHALELTGNAGYNITQFNNNTTVPTFCYKDYAPTPEYDFPASFSSVKGAVLFESGVTYKGVANCLKIYPSAVTAWQTANVEDFDRGNFDKGVYKKVTITFYYPTTNIQSARINFVSSSDYIVYPADHWQTVTFYRAGSYVNSDMQYVSFRNATSTNFAGSGTGDDDVIYISKVSTEFVCHCILDVSNIKSADNAVVNKAFNDDNKYFPYLYGGNADSFTPVPTGRKPLSIQLNVGASMTGWMNYYSSFRIWRIDAYSSRNAETVYTLRLGSEDLSVTLKNYKTKYIYLESPISFSEGSSAISVSSATASATDTLTLKFYFE